MKDKKLKKKIEKIIRYQGTEKWFYNIDRILKIKKVKIKNIKFEKEIEGGKVYRVSYTQGFNKFNPITWLLIMYLCIGAIIETIKECIEDLGELSYSESFAIKDKEDKKNK